MERLSQGASAGVALAGALMAAVAFAASPPAQSPKPAALETYKDWIIGCDNGGRCEAASLMPADETNLDSAITMTVVRDAGPGAQPQLIFHVQDDVKGPLTVLVDGAQIAIVPASDAVDPTVVGEAALSAIRALAKGARLDLKADGKVLGQGSLAGSAAALRYMDARQGRAGTVTALVATGKLGATAVRPAPALPVIHRAVVPQTKGAPLWRLELAAARKLTGCEDELSPIEEAEVYPLDGGQSLVLVPCGAGAYNFSSAALIATGRAGRRSFSIARFDSPPGWGTDEGQSMPLLVNAGWDAKSATLSSFAKGRGLGDCGSAESYVWDGHMFRMVLASSMGECRGNWNWITTWRARTAPK